jgi:DNA topoisomerase-3
LIKRKDVSALVNACDAGREGELIFRLIQQHAKSKHPVKRLWLQSMTPQAIRDGFASLRSDAQMQPLADAARCRSEADWMVGINGTRAMTAFNSRDGGFFLTTVGRVQTPTLSVVVEREEQIRKFVSRDYWEVHASFHVAAGSYAGKWLDPAFKKGGATGDDEQAKADRVWAAAKAQAIADSVRGQVGSVTEQAKPTTQASPLLFDLTSLQREANGRFGYSAKTTLQLAQSLYERHKALTYPRTDSRALPEDYVPVVKKTFEMLADSGMRHLAPHALVALNKGYIKPTKRVFDNTKVSDHFAIIPTLEAPSGLSDAEQKLYDLVVRRFMAVFYPSAEYLVTTRLTVVQGHTFQSNGKVLVNPGWLAIFGKEAQDPSAEGAADGGQNLVAVQAGESALTADVESKALKTKPPARYTEATLLGAMEGAGKLVEDDELREAMQEKGLGTPATRSSIIEGLIAEKYMLREGRELMATAKSSQLMTLLRGLGVEELSKPALTGEWEYKLSQMEQGKISRTDFMSEIAAMTHSMVDKAKSYDRDTIPGDYATLTEPCPNCGGVVRENYRRFACVGKDEAATGCGFSFTKTPAGRTFELAEADQFLREQKIGPLEGFRSKAGWPFVAELALVRDEETQNFKLEFDFGDAAKEAVEAGELQDLSGKTSLGPCPKCGSGVYELGSSYYCEKTIPTLSQATPSCDFKSGRIILQQPVEPEQMAKLLATGKTDLLDKFVSMRTRRGFKAFLSWNKEEGKVAFEFEPRAEGARKFPPRKTAPAKTAGVKAVPPKKAAAKKVAVKKAHTKKVAAKKTATKKVVVKKSA